MKRFFLVIGTSGWSFGRSPFVRTERTGGSDFQVFVGVYPSGVLGGGRA